MGITGKSAIRAAMFGSNTLKLIDKNLYPVMIIPPDAKYKGLSNVAFASDFKNVEDVTPSDLISAVLEMFNPKLHIIHVNKEVYVSLPAELQEGKNKLAGMFSRFNSEFYFITMNDFFDAIDTFVKDYNIDVLITVPKHQSNATSILKQRIPKGWHTIAIYPYWLRMNKCYIRYFPDYFREGSFPVILLILLIHKIPFMQTVIVPVDFSETLTECG